MLKRLKRMFGGNKVYASLSEENLTIKSDANAASYYLEKEEKSVSDVSDLENDYKEKNDILLSTSKGSEKKENKTNEVKIKKYHSNKKKVAILPIIQEEIEETKDETGIRNPSFTQLENKKNENLFVK